MKTMELKKVTVHLDKGFDDVLLNCPKADFFAKMGEPDEKDTLADFDEPETEIWVYDLMGLSVFFEEEMFTSFEIDAENAILFGTELKNLSKTKIIKLLKDNNIENHTSETEEWGEERVTFEDYNADFYFEDNKLNCIHLGA